MDDLTLRLRLATVFVEALEVGSGKQESDLVAEFCQEFGVDFVRLERRFPPGCPNRASLLRADVAKQLADQAPTASSLFNAVARLGGRYIAMVEETYALLRNHTATTDGTSETFRFTRGDIDEATLTISPAFLEQIRRLGRVSTSILIGRIDEASLLRFIAPDSGELYGQWPVRSSSREATRVAEDLLQLRWVEPELARLADRDDRYQAVSSLAGYARQQGRLLVAAAEAVVASHLTALQLLADAAADQIVDQVFQGPTPSEWEKDRRKEEIERFRDDGILGITAVPGAVDSLASRSLVGVTTQLVDVAVEREDYASSSGVGALAGFIALWRQARWGARREAELADEILPIPELAEDWLRQLSQATRDAATWLRTDVLHHDRTVTAEQITEVFEDYLNLPLWRQRDLLYEVWVLCTTLTACEQAGWHTRLTGLTETGGVWLLARGATTDPIAELTKGGDALEVWREPRRQTPSGILTPDVTVSTPAPYRRDLAVVEAKDRTRMPSGVKLPAHLPPTLRHARGVADRYAQGLVPAVTWVCNHNDFREAVDPTDNLGHAWSRIHLADRFRPGEVPPSFADSIRDALRVPSSDDADLAFPRLETLILAVDITSSMKARIPEILRQLSAPDLRLRFNSYRVVQFGDHIGDLAPLVSESGPFDNLDELVRALGSTSYRRGSVDHAAIEEALHACNALAAGPCTIAVVSDAAAHSREDCPNRLVLEREAIRLLNSGASLHVVDDWIDDDNTTWTVLDGRTGFQLARFALLMDGWRAAD